MKQIKSVGFCSIIPNNNCFKYVIPLSISVQRLFLFSVFLFKFVKSLKKTIQQILYVR